MDYENLFRRAANIVWDHKFLIVLGILASLAGAGGGGGWSFGGGDFGADPGAQPAPPGEFQLPDLSGEAGAFLGLAGIALLALLCVLFIIAIIVFVLGTVANGGIIAGVHEIEQVGASSLGSAWGAAWERAASLIGNALLPIIPALFLAAIGVAVALATVGAQGIAGAGDLFGGAAAAVIIPLICIFVPLILVLSALRIFADRATMLEGYGTLDAYRRGWDVLKSNLGAAVLLFLLQIVLQIVIGLLLIVPSIILILCCFLWPLLLIFQGAVAAFFSSVWTLAYREWTGLDVDAAKLVEAKI